MDIGTSDSSEALELNVVIVICPLKATALSRIFCCSPIPVAMAIIITIMPIAMAVIPIFIIGADTLLLYDLLPIMRLAIKYSNFNLW